MSTPQEAAAQHSPHTALVCGVPPTSSDVRNKAGEADGLSPGRHLLLSALGGSVVLSEGNHRLGQDHCCASRALDLVLKSLEHPLWRLDEPLLHLLGCSCSRFSPQGCLGKHGGLKGVSVQ